MTSITPSIADDNTLVDSLAKDRNISPEWIRANCKRYDEGWIIEGYGTGKHKKPDNPRKDRDGKVIKYENLPDQPCDLWIPKTPDGTQAIFTPLLEGKGTLTITEGAFKAIKATEGGIPTACVQGVWNGTKKDGKGGFELVPQLQKAVKAGLKNVCIAFDADAATNPDIAKASIRLGEVLTKEGVTVTIATGQWTVEEGKGMDDFISNHGIEAMRERLERALTLDAYKAQTAKKSGEAKGRKARYEAIKTYFDGSLKYNLMTRQIERNGEYYANERLYCRLSIDGVIDGGKEECIDLMREIADEQSYHPVVDYFNKLREKYTDDTDMNAIKQDISLLEGCLGMHWDKIFGEMEYLSKIYLTKMLVGHVQRTLNPGCEMQSLLILYGKQGTRKSTFLKKLLGEYAYSNAYNGTTEKDDLDKLHNASIHEIAEFDKIYRKSDAATLKDIITTSVDKFRPSYGRETLKYPRQCTLWGTTNRNDFLNDPTGSRRFWVVPCKQVIDTTYLEKNRDEIWYVALMLFDLGYTYWLDEMQEAMREDDNYQYQSVSTVRELVLDYCFQGDKNGNGISPVCVEEIWARYEPDSDKKQMTNQERREYCDALMSFGYTSNGDKGRKMFNNKRCKTWSLTFPQPCDSSVTGTRRSGQERSCGGQPYTASVFLPSDRLTAKNENFPKNDLNENDTPEILNKTISEESFENRRSSGQETLEPIQDKADRCVTGADRTPLCRSDVPLAFPTVKVGDMVEVINDNNYPASCGTVGKVVEDLGDGCVKILYESTTLAGRKIQKPSILMRGSYKVIS